MDRIETTQAAQVLSVRGFFKLELRRKAQLLYAYQTRNMIVSTGENLAAQRIFGAGAGPVTHMALGTSNLAAAKSQVALQAELGIARVAYTGGGASYVAGNLVHLLFVLTPAAPISNVSEVGVFTAATFGVMVSRAVVSPFNMDAGMGLTVQWEMQFLGTE